MPEKAPQCGKSAGWAVPSAPQTDGRAAPAWILGSPQFAALLLRPWMTKVEEFARFRDPRMTKVEGFARSCSTRG